MGLKITRKNLIVAAERARTTKLTIHIIKGKDGNEIDLRLYSPGLDSAKVQADPEIVVLIPYRNILEQDRTMIPIYLKDYA